MTDVHIPEPGGPLLTGPTVLTGQHLVGEVATGDTWVDHPLALDGGSAQVFVGALIAVEATGTLELPPESAELIVTVVRNDIVAVDITGMLDLPREPDTQISVSINLVIEVDTNDVVELVGDQATVYTEKNIVLSASDLPLELAGDPVRLTIEVIMRIAVDAVIPLALDGSKHVHVNPVLMPSECLDLDLEQVTCTDLDLVTIVCDPIDLTPVVCAHDGQLTILNTFKLNERVLKGELYVWLTPLTSSDCIVLEPVPVGCLDA